MSKLAKALTAAAGNAGGESLYVEDVFSTYLYTGNGTARNITNGIDLDGEGGLVWTKSRQSGGNYFTDTERGAGRLIASNNTDAESYTADTQKTVTGFNSDGYSLGTDTGNWGHNFNSSYDYASWTFRKAEKFFDVVTYTGDGVAGRTVAHNLGSVPGCIIVKSTSDARNWSVFHTSTTSTHRLLLNDTAAASDDANYWDDTEPTSSEFTVGSQLNVNKNGATYVAYLFASDAGGFGDDGSESIIKCGSYTGNGGTQEINLGFEPQWLLVKRATGTSRWFLIDSMRGFFKPPAVLEANSSAAEQPNLTDGFSPTATGFKVEEGWAEINASGNDYIYIAIRRPMKTPESGTEVFNTVSLGTTTEPGFVSGFVTDFSIHRTVNETGSRQVSSRMTGNKYMFSDATNAEGSISAIQWDFMDGSRVGNGTANANEIQWMFKRATGFFDVVAYTGDGSARTIEHNLGVAPELMIVKGRSTGSNWGVYNAISGAHRWIKLNDNGGLQTEATPSIWNDTEPTASVFSLCASTASDASTVNENGTTYIAYLFATLAGVSKVGSYTGTGSNVDVDCGFSAGARFILIKRTDSIGDWYVWDSVRGIVAGNDPYLLLNSTAAEVTSTDYIDPLSSGFTVTSSAPAALNASGGSYIFLAIS